MPGETTNGRVAHDEVERLAGHGLEEAALADVEVEPVERGRGAASWRDGPGVEVGGHDPVDVGGEVERLDAAPGAEVERASPTGRRTVSWASEVEAGLMPRTWSAAITFGAAVEARGQVGEHPPVDVVVGVRADVDRRPDHVPVRSSTPAPTRASTRPGKARSRPCAAGTSACSGQSRVSVSSGEPPVVARSPGVVSLRASAAWPTGPSAAATPSTV